MHALIRRLFPMHKDVVPNWRPRHRGRPALVARRPVDFVGATEDWDVRAELAAADALTEPEETLEEATLREFAEIVDHWAAEEQRIADEVRSWFDDLVKDDPIAAVLLDQERERLARKASVAAADAVEMPTGEYPVVRELVTV